jgi:biotin-dependent carboxylase-like uncharacterized protein
MMPALKVVSPGLMTTLQDLGRRGYQRLGIPVAGALDEISLRAANLIAGNPATVGALEIAYQGPTLEVEADSVRIAYAGGTAALDILQGKSTGEARQLPPLQSVRLTKGHIVRIGALSGSPVGYLAVEGGFDVPLALGSQSTYMRGGLGGFAGRALQMGDILSLKRPHAEEREERMLPSLDLTAPKRIRVVFGPQDDYFTDKGKHALVEGAYVVTPASDRMGMRLDGPPLEHAKGYNIVSDGISPGSIQVPGNGVPIVLLADRQTTGGYPKIATVISADMPALGRLAPGAKVAFEAVDIVAAEAAHRQFLDGLQSLAKSITAARAAVSVDEGKLLGSNLVSGVVNAWNWQEVDV